MDASLKDPCCAVGIVMLSFIALRWACLAIGRFLRNTFRRGAEQGVLAGKREHGTD